jgi:hypothetical protein
MEAGGKHVDQSKTKEAKLREALHPGTHGGIVEARAKLAEPATTSIYG